MKRKVAFLDLSISSEAEREEVLCAVERVLMHGRLINGPEVQLLEEQVAALCRRHYAIGVGSGTDALFLALKCLGLGPGDEVITTSLSWIATANAIALTGAVPVFADIGEELNIDSDSVERLVTPRTKAIVPVHFTGRLCDMPSLMEIASEHGLALVEDAAQSFSASAYGHVSGSFGVLAALSMNPMKVFAACGEAGMVVTDSAEMRDRLLALRYNGMVNRRECIAPSINGRLDTIQAAILLQRLEGLDRIIKRRREIAAYYNQALSYSVQVPKDAPGERQVYYTYTIRADRRDALKAFLEERGIETQIQHPCLMPMQPAYHGRTRGEWPNAERLVGRVLCLPANEKLLMEEIRYVASTVREFYQA